MSNLSLLESRALAALTTHADAGTTVSFSGGKDSLVALDLAYRVGIRRAVFCDTSVEFPETVNFVNHVAEVYDIDLKVVRPHIGFFDLIERVTAPSKKQRWCCDVLKFGPLTEWALANHATAFITGIRRSESSARADYAETDWNPLVPVKQLNPILEWSAADVWDYTAQYGLPVSPLYQFLTRVGCWCCPFKTPSEWSAIEQRFPERVAEFKTRLASLAARLGIKEQKAFVEDFGWAHWVYPTRKVVVGSTRMCGNQIIVQVTGADDALLRRVCGLLPILTSDFKAQSGRLRITVDASLRKRTEILIERALNCIGCGACLSRCTQQALRLENGVIRVQTDRCTRCHVCLNASVLKGSCISRHYSPKHAGIIRAEGLPE